jgi:hypothetical protein
MGIRLSKQAQGFLRFASVFFVKSLKKYCKMQNLEKSLSASTLDGFQAKLLQLEPTSRHSAINVEV